MAGKKSARGKKAVTPPSKRYVGDKGFYVDVLDAFPYRTDGIVCLVVQASPDGDRHRSEINACDDFASEDPALKHEARTWIYALCKPGGDDDFYVADSGNCVRRGPPDALTKVLEIDGVAITGLSAARSGGVFVVGLRGYVGRFDGKKLVAMPVEGADTIYSVTETSEGDVYAASGAGTLYRRARTAWKPISIAGTSEIHRVRADEKGKILLCGSDGLAGSFDGKTFTRFDAPAGRRYADIVKFQGRIFVGAGYEGLDVLEGNRVVPFKDNVYSFRLAASEKYLLAGGSNEVARFDGAAWVASSFT